MEGIRQGYMLFSLSDTLVITDVVTVSKTRMPIKNITNNLKINFMKQKKCKGKGGKTK